MDNVELFRVWRKDRERHLVTSQEHMKAKILSEFPKLSREDLLSDALDEVYQVLLFDSPDGPLNKFINYPAFTKDLQTYLEDAIPTFYQEAQVINEDGFNLMTYIEFLLNNHDQRYLYWCSYPQIGQDIIEQASTYKFTLIRFNKGLYEDYFNLSGTLHPFIRALSHTWSSQYKEKTYDACFRKSAANMNEAIGGVWDTLNLLSSLKYEGSQNRGGLVFIGDETPHIILELQAPVPLSEHRQIRKLLQMSQKGHYLLINKDNIAIGFGSLISFEPVFRVEFLDHLSWRLYLGQKEYLSCNNLLPLLPDTGNNLARLKEKLAKTFDPSDYKPTDLLTIIQTAMGQAKGTMVVVTEIAAQEAQRLQTSSILIQPMRLTRHQVQLVTAIDGAVILDPQGVCHSIGSILDGSSSGTGDPSRGARYNSALPYANAQKGPRCLVVVVSEDKYIDILVS